MLSAHLFQSLSVSFSLFQSSCSANQLAFRASLASNCLVAGGPHRARCPPPSPSFPPPPSSSNRSHIFGPLIHSRGPLRCDRIKLTTCGRHVIGQTQRNKRKTDLYARCVQLDSSRPALPNAEHWEMGNVKPGSRLST